MKTIKRILLVLLLILVGGFILLMLLPDEEEETPHVITSGTGKMEASSETEIPQTLLDIGAAREKQVQLKGDGTDTVTVMVYMNGSDLESDDSEATTDLEEMVRAGESENVHVVVQTMGTKSWDKKYGIASNRSQRYEVGRSGLNLLQDNLGQLDCTKTETLSDFIRWSAATYPADRYILMFWDHGGGPVYGFGYDQWNDDENASLSVDEIRTALLDAGVYFDFIGMDCCIMSTLETCCAMYDFCDYMILSEDFESGLGWSYTGWLQDLYRNSSTPTVDLGVRICDDFVSANETSSDGDESIMALIDQSMLKVLYSSWMSFAYENEQILLANNYSRSVLQKKGGRLLPAMQSAVRGAASQRTHASGARSFLDLFGDEEDYSISDYYITDIMAVANRISSGSSDTLAAAVAQTLVYVRNTDGDADLTGIAVTLPYGDSEFYSQMAVVFRNIGIEQDYITWLEKFTGVNASGSSSYYDEDDYSWDGWENYEDDYDWDNWEDDRYTGWLDLLFDWDDWDYEDSYNNWYDEDDWYYEDEDDDYYYEGNDWFWDDWDYDDYEEEYYDSRR